MKKYVAIIGAALGIVLILTGFMVDIPDRELSRYGAYKVPQYINGDAYNYQIEAAIRGGEISGAKASKAVFITGGCILMFLSAFSFAAEMDEEKKKALTAATAPAPAPTPVFTPTPDVSADVPSEIPVETYVAEGQSADRPFESSQ